MLLFIHNKLGVGEGIMKYTIVYDKLDILDIKLKRLFKKFDKNGIPYTYNIFDTFFEEVEDSCGNKMVVKFVNIEIDGFYKIGNYLVVAMARCVGADKRFNEFTIFSNEVTSDTLETFRYRFACDHCNSNRHRSCTYIIYDGNEFKQVGSSCLQEYIGVDPSAYTAYYSFVDCLDELSNSEKLNVQSLPKYYDVANVLSLASDIIGKYGYVPKYTNDGRFNQNNTADYVLKLLVSGESGKSNISNIINFFRELNDETAYIQDIKSALSMGYVTEKKVGMIASSILAHSKHLEKQQRLAVELSAEYYGSVGDKVKIVGKLSTITSYDTTFGTTYIYKITCDNAIFIWKTSIVVMDGLYEVVGCIKEHNEYNGVNQTILTRCKVVPMDKETKYWSSI